MKNIFKQYLFHECYEYNIPLRSCPSFLFFILGSVTVLIMLSTYIAIKEIANPDIIIWTTMFIAIIMMLISYLVTSGVKQIFEAKRTAESEKAKTESIIKNFIDGLILINKQGEISLINKEAEKLLNVKEEDVIGKRVGSPELGIHEHFQKVTKNCPVSADFEAKKCLGQEIELSENQRKVLEIKTFPLKNPYGETLGFIKLIHDKTREKEIEELKSSFISIASHQLRSPLSGEKWLLEMLLNEKQGNLTPTQRDCLEKAYESNASMLKLVEDLLNVSRIEEGRIKPNLAKADYVKLIEETIKLYDIVAKSKNVQFIFEKKDNIPMLMVDKENIKLVIDNLISNAINYSKPKNKVIIRVEKIKKGIKTSIIDFGSGIPKSEQGKIFSKFYRGSNVKMMQIKGSGLGLFIAKNIVEKHGGKLEFKSRENKGTTFYFTLPI